MKYKIIIFILIFSFLFTIPVIGSQDLDVSYIQELIKKDNTEKALRVLNNANIENNPDLLYYKALLLSWNKDYKQAMDILTDLIKQNPDKLEFYNQIARIHGWRGNYNKATEIIAKAQKKKVSPVRTAILAQHAEWQNKWFEAVKLRKEAYEQAQGTDLEVEYKKLWRKARKNILPTNFVKTEFKYEYGEQDDLTYNILIGQERPIRDGLTIKGSGGVSVLRGATKYLARGNINIKKPILPSKMSLNSSVNFIGDVGNKELHYNNNFNYILNPKNTLGIYVKFFESDENPYYQTIELENEYKYKNYVITLKNTSRHDSSGWNYNFSQHLDLYYPTDNYLLHFTLSHYDGGEYVFRAGVELSDIFLNNDWKINNLNSWINNKNTSVINIRFDQNK